MAVAGIREEADVDRVRETRERTERGERTGSHRSTQQTWSERSKHSREQVGWTKEVTERRCGCSVSERRCQCELLGDEAVGAVRHSHLSTSEERTSRGDEQTG